MVAAHLRSLTSDASEMSRNFISCAEGVMGGRPVIRGTRITVLSVQGRISGGDSIEDLMRDYPEVPRAAFEAAATYGIERDRPTSRSPRTGE